MRFLPCFFDWYNFIKQYIQYCIMSSGGNIRIVKYNEDLFKVPSRTQKRKKPDKPIKLKSPKKVSNKSIKNNILKEIRKNQEEKYKLLMNEPKITSNNLSNDFENDFKDSVEFMKKVADRHKETKINQTIKNHNASVVDIEPSPVQKNQILSPNLLDTDLIPVRLDEPSSMLTNIMEEVGIDFPIESSFDQSSFDQPSFDQPSFDQPSFDQPSSYHVEPIQILPTPNYGCLKNGSLPTYRAYNNKTMKMHEPPSSSPLVAERIKSPTELLLIEKLKQRETELKTKNHIAKQKKYKKLLRRTYRVGRDKYRPKVGILLPNKTIRTNVTTKSYLLKQTPIDEIRKTLVKQGFIKVGSSAPNDVLRKIYESIKMIDGDINNHNSDNLLYNFFNEKK